MKITKANGVVEYQLLAQLKQRAGETDPKITEAVTTIINGVKEGGDEAVREYTVRFDGSVVLELPYKNVKPACLRKSNLTRTRSMPF